MVLQEGDGGEEESECERMFGLELKSRIHGGDRKGMLAYEQEGKVGYDEVSELEKPNR